MARKYKRKKKLIMPKFQLKAAGACLGLAVLAVLTMMVLLNEAILDFADQGWVDAAMLQDKWIGVLLSKLAIALLIFAPMTLALGVILMHRVAGPLYRFDKYLRSVIAGEETGDCRIRDGDELVEMCNLLNRLTKPMRDGTVPLAPFQAAMEEGEAPTELKVDETPAAETPAEDVEVETPAPAVETEAA